MNTIPKGNESVTPEAIRNRVETLFHTQMSLSLLDWQPIAQDLLGAATRIETMTQEAPKAKFCLWEWDVQRQCNDTECGKYVTRFDGESPMKYCPFCGGIITAM